MPYYRELAHTSQTSNTRTVYEIDVFQHIGISKELDPYGTRVVCSRIWVIEEKSSGQPISIYPISAGQSIKGKPGVSVHHSENLI